MSVVYIVFVVYFTIFSLVLIALLNIKYLSTVIQNIFGLFSQSEKKQYYIILLFLIFYLIAILPISDADSLAIHQYFATYIFENKLSFT